MKQAPKISSGDAIELEPLVGKAVAVKVTGRRKVATKYGERELNEVLLLPEGAKEPLEGVLFQAYFTKLDLHEWYCGIVRKDEKRWFLEPANSKQARLLESAINQLPDDDTPF